MPLLSLCIPTYNRAHLLPQTLQSILEQLSADMKDQVEIVVSDDGTDDTKAVVDGFMAKSQVTIRYFKNDRNLGHDGNLPATVERAAGRYCWFIGDDDMMKQGALARVIGAIDRPETRFLLLNYSRFDHATEKVVIERMIELNSETFTDKNAFFFAPTPRSKFPILGMNLIYLSAAVFCRDHWLKYIDYYDQYRGINYIHSFVFQAMIAKDTFPVEYIGDPMIDYRAGNARDWGTEIWYDYHTKLLKEAKKLGYDKKIIFRMQSKFYYKYYRNKLKSALKSFIRK